MASEKFANLAETTLASGYTSGGASISVTSAAGFPTVGVFRVRLGNAGKTIYRVDSVSGTTFTGAAEANDANANNGDAVKIAASRAVAERFIQEPDSSEIAAYAGVSAANRWGPIFKLAPFSQSGWTWTNQGSASISEASGIVYFKTPAAGGENMRVRSVAVPATPYKFAFGIIPNPSTVSGNSRIGVCLRESGTGKLISISLIEGQQIQIVKDTNATTFSSAPATRGINVVGAVMFLRVGADGTNITFELSFDALNWFSVFSEAKAAFFTTAPDEVGISLLSTAVEIGASYISMLQS